MEKTLLRLTHHTNECKLPCRLTTEQKEDRENEYNFVSTVDVC